MSDLPRPADDCGECVTDERAVPASPYAVALDADGEGIRASYRCAECGHWWRTGWSLHALGFTGSAGAA